MKTPEQLKGTIRSMATKKNLRAQEVLQMFLFERILDRLANSDYQKNFILKGGLLISSMIGIGERTTMDMIFERLDEWIWSLEHDKPPTMSGVAPQLALESLARIYGESQSGLPTIEFSSKQENALRRIALLQGKITECNREIKTYEKEIEAHSVRIAEIMKEHEHGVLTTTSDKLLIDYVTKSTTRPDSKVLKAKYPTILPDVMKTTQSRKVKVSVQPL